MERIIKKLLTFQFSDILIVAMITLGGYAYNGMWLSWGFGALIGNRCAAMWREVE